MSDAVTKKQIKPKDHPPLPASVKIGSQIWSLSEQDRKTAYDDEVYGFTNDREYVIVIDAGMAFGVKRTTLLHEILHAIRFTFGGSFKPAKSTEYLDWEHYFIGLYEEPLIMVLRDNPEVLAYLMAGE